MEMAVSNGNGHLEWAVFKLRAHFGERGLQQPALLAALVVGMHWLVLDGRDFEQTNLREAADVALEHSRKHQKYNETASPELVDRSLNQRV